MYEMIESFSLDVQGEKIAIYLDEPSHNSICDRTEKEKLVSIIEDLLGYYNEKYGDYPYERR